MIFHFVVFFWSIIFSFGLGVISYYPAVFSWGWYFLAVTPLCVISLSAIRRLTKCSSDAFLPLLLSFSSPLLLSLIDRPAERVVFVILGTLMYYMALLSNYRLHHAPIDKTGEAFLNTSAMAGIFFFYAGLYGFYLNFTFPLWGLMLLFVIGTTLTSYETFISVDKSKRRRVLFYSTLTGLVMGEMAWVMSFWPFGYLTTGALGLIAFFVVWDISFDAFRNTLSLKKAFFRVLFFLALMILLLWSSPWRILV